MSTALMIINPAAARTSRDAAHAVADVLLGAGWRLEMLATSGPGDARRLATWGVTEGVDVVVVQGGDGTTMQAAAALVGTDVALGLIPGGTGNLLAGNLRIPRSPVRAARLLLSGRRRRIDLGRIVRPRDPLYFSVACGSGIDARVMGETEARAKWRWGMGAYVATTLRVLPEVRNHPHRITVDGTVHEADAAMVLVANCGEIIPGAVRLGRHISPDDGLLDVLCVPAEGVWGSMQAVWRVLRSLRETGENGTFTGYARGREITVEAEPPQPAEMDGDTFGSTPFTAEVVPGALTVFTPE